MSRLLRGICLLLFLLVLGAAPVFFGAVHIWSATWVYLAAIILACLGASILVPPKQGTSFHAVDGVVALFLILVLIGFLRSPNGFQSRQEFLNVLSCVLFYFLVRFCLRRTAHQKLVAGVLFTVAVGISVYAISQHYSSNPHVLWKPQYVNYLGRASGTYICPNHFAGYLAMVIPLIISIAFWARIPAYLRIFLVYGVGVMGLGLFFSYSRGGLLSTIVGLGAVLFLGVRKKVLAAASIVIFAAVMIAGVLFFLEISNQEQSHRFLEAVQRGESSRAHMWKSAWQVFLTFPVMGVGPMMFDWWHAHFRGELLFRAIYAHNDYLHLLADYGLVGGILGLLAVGFLFVRIFRGIRKFRLFSESNRGPEGSDRLAFQKAFFVGATGSIVALLSHLIVDFDLHILANAITFSVLSAFVVSLSCDSPSETDSRLPGVYKIGLSAVLFLSSLWLVPMLFQNFWGDFWRRQAVESDKAFEWKDADRQFQWAIEADPESSRTWEDYCQYLYKRCFFTILQRPHWIEQFMKACDRALQENSMNYLLRVQRAEIYDLQGKFELAEKEYREALDFDPNNPYYLSRFGLHFQRRGINDQAIRYFTRAMELNGRDAVAQQNLQELKPM